MANSLFESLNGNQMNIQEQMRLLQANPVQFLMQRRLNIPQELQNDPRGMVQHLLNTGQMKQSDFDRLQGIVQNIAK